MEGLSPCPLCGSTNVTCFAEYDGDTYDSGPIYRAVVGCLGCHEEGCDPSYDEEPCFGIEAYFPGSHPLIKDCEDPSDCERALERHMAERWNRRAERTCRIIEDGCGLAHCSGCGFEFDPYDCSGIPEEGVPYEYDGRYCKNCGAKVAVE